MLQKRRGGGGIWRIQDFVRGRGLNLFSFQGAHLLGPETLLKP